MKKLSTIVLLLSIVTAYAQGKIDGFYKGKNNGAVVLGLGFEDGKKYFAGGSGKLDLTRSVSYGNLFGAYGITDDLDANISIPYIVSDDNADFQDISIYLKYRLFKSQGENGKFEISAAGGFSTNITDYDLGRTQRYWTAGNDF